MAKPPRKIQMLAAGIFVSALTIACNSPTQGGEEGGGDDDVETTETSGEAAFTWAITGADKEIHEQVAELWNEQNPENQVEVAFLAPTADEQRQAMFQDLQSGAGEFDV